LDYVDKRAHHRPWFGSAGCRVYQESRTVKIRSLYTHRILLALLVAAALAVALMTILVIRQQQSQADGQVFLETGGSAGANPFVPLVVPPADTGANQGSGGTSFRTTASTDNRTTCDPEKLVSYLAGNQQASEAWVRALNSDRGLSWSGGSRVEIQQIPSYLHELTPRLLADDLRVTNYQFTNGAALAVQSVLEKGTAVLMDAKGVARVRCACGNPLTPMIQLKVPPIYRGTPWPTFRPQRVIVAQRGPQCGDAEYRGDDGRCHGPSQPWPPANDERPDPQRWQDEPVRRAEPPYADKPGRPDKTPYPDKPGRPDEPAYPEKLDRTHDSPRPGKPGPDGLPPHYPDMASGPDGPKHPDKPAVPDQSVHQDKPASPHPDEPAEDRPVESKAGHDAAQPSAEPEKSAVPGPRVPQHSGPPPGRSLHPARQDRPHQSVPAEKGRSEQAGQTTAGSHRGHDLGTTDADHGARAADH
jgi:hypothetical protein